MAFNKNVYRTRYSIEQDSLPTTFFETPKDVIRSVLEPGNNTFYKLYKTLIERTGEVSPYLPEHFKTNCFKFDDGTLGCYVTLPNPESVMLCAAIVYVFSPSMNNNMFFTVETDEAMGRMTYKLCSIDADKKHTVYGACNLNPSEIIHYIKAVYSRAK